MISYRKSEIPEHLLSYFQPTEMGLEETPEAYTEAMVDLFRDLRRVLADDGTIWLNIGDSYAGGGGGNYNKTGISQAGGQHITNVRNRPEWLENAGLKPKDLIGIPWRVAFALQQDGWYLRSDIIWHKPNPMPESVTDRPTKSHEYLFLLTKSPRYYYDREAIREPIKEGNTGYIRARARTAQGALGGENQHNVERRDYAEIKGANKRSVWTVTTKPFKGAHFAVMPEALVEPCLLAGSAEGDTVLDPFTGSGTVGVVALRHGRNFVGTELNPEYGEIARERISAADPLFNQVEVS